MQLNKPKSMITDKQITQISLYFLHGGAL